MKDIRASRRTAPGLAPRMLIVYRAIDELIPDPANPRRHSRKQIGQIANSIEVFGFNVPILIDRHGNVICGHGRLLACHELGITEVPTRRNQLVVATQPGGMLRRPVELKLSASIT